MYLLEADFEFFSWFDNLNFFLILFKAAWSDFGTQKHIVLVMHDMDILLELYA